MCARMRAGGWWFRLGPLVSLGAVVASLGLFSIWARRVTRDPMDTPITLRRSATVSCRVTIRAAEDYYLRLAFAREDRSWLDATRVLGESSLGADGAPVRSGAPLDLKWALRRPGQLETVWEADGTYFGCTGTGPSAFFRTLGIAHLDVGEYVFHAEVRGDAPELAGWPARIQLYVDDKDRASWQYAVVVVGTCVGYPVLGCAALVLAFVSFRPARLRRRD